MNTRVARATARHALGWLVAANVVGVLLATLLVWPELNGPLTPLTYGRWMPLHLDWQLYGWCSLPLAGALGAWLIDSADTQGQAWFEGSLTAWSVALALGGVSWLGGVTSGKLFLDWSGWARPWLPAAMLVLWLGLASACWRRRMEFGRRAWGLRVAVLAGLLVAPAVLFWSMERDVYPSVNPDSGGATGASLLGSTLALMAIAGWLPHALGLARRPERTASHGLFWIALLLAGGVFAVIDRGNASHHAAGQIIALGTLLAWVPLIAYYFRGFIWPSAARRWLRAAAVWWAVLVTTGWWTFLPGASERWKFTHVLVAHAHLAMAGVVTCVGAAVLAGLGRGPGGGAGAFWGWQGATAVHLAALVALGEGEALDASGFFGGAAWVRVLMAARLVAGVGMLAASLAWLKEETT